MSEDKQKQAGNKKEQGETAASVFEQFSTQFLRGMSVRMRETYSSTQLDEFLKERFTFFQEATRRSGMVRVKPHQSSTVSQQGTRLNYNVIVEISVTGTRSLILNYQLREPLY
jgi:NAD-specific glutamate dehydrogenase